ncbi:MAG: calcium:proton antiporter [Alsobacter sp.]
MTPATGLASLSSALGREWFLALSVGTCIVFLAAGPQILGSLHNVAVLVGVFAWLFGAILGSALAVVRHADHLAEHLGEPYGTLILTLSVTAIEVMSISAIMLHGENNPALVRDTLFAVIMIILNGMVGLSLLVGGWRHREQHYNLQGANAYLGAIIPLAVLALVLPDYTVTTVGPSLSIHQAAALGVMSIGLYAVFLATQTGRHRGYFTFGNGEPEHAEPQKAGGQSVRFHAAFLAAYMVPVVFLAEQLAHPVDYIIDNAHAPAMLGGVVIAILVATPEGVGAVRAAFANHLQRSTNIFLGSVLSTIGLTVPAMIAMSYATGRPILLGLEHTNVVMLLLTLGVSVVTFASGRTNMLQGVVHLLLFAVFVLLIFEG